MTQGPASSQRIRCLKQLAALSQGSAGKGMLYQAFLPRFATLWLLSRAVYWT